MEGCLKEVKKETLCMPLKWSSCRLAKWPEARQPQGAGLGASCHNPVASSQYLGHHLCTASSFPQGSACSALSSFLLKKALTVALLPESCLLPLLGPALKTPP